MQWRCWFASVALLLPSSWAYLSSNDGSSDDEFNKGPKAVSARQTAEHYSNDMTWPTAGAGGDDFFPAKWHSTAGAGFSLSALKDAAGSGSETRTLQQTLNSGNENFSDAAGTRRAMLQRKNSDRTAQLPTKSEHYINGLSNEEGEYDWVIYDCGWSQFQSASEVGNFEKARINENRCLVDSPVNSSSEHDFTHEEGLEKALFDTCPDCSRVFASEPSDDSGNGTGLNRDMFRQNLNHMQPELSIFLGRNKKLYHSVLMKRLSYLGIVGYKHLLNSVACYCPSELLAVLSVPFADHKEYHIVLDSYFEQAIESFTGRSSELFSAYEAMAPQFSDIRMAVAFLGRLHSSYHKFVGADMINMQFDPSSKILNEAIESISSMDRDDLLARFIAFPASVARDGHELIGERNRALFKKHSLSKAFYTVNDIKFGPAKAIASMDVEALDQVFSALDTTAKLFNFCRQIWSRFDNAEHQREWSRIQLLHKWSTNNILLASEPLLYFNSTECNVSLLQDLIDCAPKSLGEAESNALKVFESGIVTFSYKILMRPSYTCSGLGHYSTLLHVLELAVKFNYTRLIDWCCSIIPERTVLILESKYRPLFFQLLGTFVDSPIWKSRLGQVFLEHFSEPISHFPRIVSHIISGALVRNQIYTLYSLVTGTNIEMLLASLFETSDVPSCYVGQIFQSLGFKTESLMKAFVNLEGDGPMSQFMKIVRRDSLGDFAGSEIPVYHSFWFHVKQQDESLFALHAPPNVVEFYKSCTS